MRTLRGWRWQGLAALLLLLVLAGAGCGGGDGGSKDDAPAEQTVNFQEPEDPGPDPFTEPADVEGSEEVSLQETGGGGGGSQPYGGSGSDKVCDRDKLVRFLRENPDRMREWARVVGISPSYRAVSKYIAKLHPVTLTRDTQVTNHSFVNGRAVPFQAILQAGTAVLVDDYGRPVARCRCGNPLAKPVYVKSAKCVGCPANYTPPRQCKLYVRRASSRDAYTGDYYRNDEYDAVFIDASRSGPYKNCYTAYPDPPVVTIVDVYREPPPEPEVQEATPPPETTPEPSEPNCENPRSQYEYEQCHPPQEEPTEPQPDPDYDCPDQPPAHPGEDYLRNCPG
jgi:hypothetical protein